MTTRQPHLPPRCPIQKKPNSGPIHDPSSLPQHINESYPQHHRSSSQSIIEEQPAWLDNLLNEPESASKEIVLRRSVSDTVTLLDGIADSLSSLSPQNDELSVDNGTGSGLESASLYGPNSPRRRGNLSFSENAIVSALSEYVSHEPIEYMDGTLCISGITHTNSKGDDFRSIGELNEETKAVKRHPGQRSRIRKLQYIAELERTVDVLQTLESELSIRVASLHRQHVALSMEKNKLKQQMARLQQEKLIMDGEFINLSADSFRDPHNLGIVPSQPEEINGQYQSLKREIKRLKMGLTNPRNNKIEAYFGSSPTNEAARIEAMQILDLGKLTLN